MYMIINLNGNVIGSGVFIFGNISLEVQLFCDVDYNFNIINFVDCGCVVQGLNLSVDGIIVFVLGIGNFVIEVKSYFFIVDFCNIIILDGECIIDFINFNFIGIFFDNCDIDLVVFWEFIGVIIGLGNGYFN